MIFFLSLTNGKQFAANTAAATLIGAISQAGFCLTYSWLARRWSWLLALTGSCLAFFVATFLLQQLNVPLLLRFSLVVFFLLLAVQLLPETPNTTTIAKPLPT